MTQHTQPSLLTSAKSRKNWQGKLSHGIHRHSTAATHYHDIVQYSQDVLSPQRKEFMAHDIRRELSQILHVGLNFEIPYGLQDEHDPIDYLMDTQTL